MQARAEKHTLFQDLGNQANLYYRPKLDPHSEY